MISLAFSTMPLVFGVKGSAYGQAGVGNNHLPLRRCRDAQTVNHLFLDGFPNSTLVHDGWKPQLNTNCPTTPNLRGSPVENTKYLIEKYLRTHWTKAFLQLLNDAIKRNKNNQKITDVDRIKSFKGFKTYWINRLIK